MKLQSKQSIVVAVGIFTGIIVCVFLLLVFGNRFVEGHNFVDMDGIRNQIADAIEEQPQPDTAWLRDLLADYAKQYPGIDLEWVNPDGSVIYSSTGNVMNYSLAEMLDRLNNTFMAFSNVESFTIPYQMSIGEDTDYLLLTLQEQSTRKLQVYLLFSGVPSLLYFLIPVSLLILVPIFSIILYSTHVNRRIQRLRNAVQQTDLHNLAPTLTDRSRDEIGQLVRLFQEMSLKIKDQFEQLEYAEEQRRKLVSNLSHDLRTPLTLVIGYAENLVRRDSQQDPIASQWQTIILDKSLYIEKLLADLFEVSRVGYLEIAASSEPCNATELVSRIALDYALILQDKNMEVVIRVPEHEISLLINPFQFERAVRNLCDNAITHGEAGRYFGIVLNEDMKQVTLSVHDRGPGIPPEELSRIFEPFYSKSNHTNGDNSGLGLAIVSSIVTSQNGTISVESKPGQETVFTMTFNQ